MSWNPKRPYRRDMGREHRARRASLLQRQAQGETLFCWRCNAPLGVEWQLGHDDLDRSITRGPECVSCNQKAASERGNQIAAANRAKSRYPAAKHPGLS